MIRNIAIVVLLIGFIGSLMMYLSERYNREFEAGANDRYQHMMETGEAAPLLEYLRAYDPQGLDEKANDLWNKYLMEAI